MKRHLLVAIVSTFVTTALFAISPSARYETRMVYDPQSTHSILFGGITAVDSGTKMAYHLKDTWEWTGSRWIQRFPAHVPPERSGHVMVYDSNRSRVLMFGGHSNTVDLNDLWMYANNDWTQIQPPNSPPPRILAGGAFDPVRDRLVIYGGTQISADGKTLTPAHDTWEFDGTTWTQVGGEGPAVTKPLLAYDAARNQIIMLALDPNTATLMYTYDASSGNWNPVTPATLPPCVNEGQMTWQGSNQTVVYTGGVCSNATGADETYEWDGTTWNKIPLTAIATRVFGAAFAFDDSRQEVAMFGGTPPVGSPTADTWIYQSQNWFSLSDGTRPSARSLFTFTTDPVNNTIWMFGGTDDVTTFGDLWEYQNGNWQQLFITNTPGTCITPAAVWDTDRNKLVVVCSTSDVFEFDGSAWTAFNATKNSPPQHSWASAVYDPTLKKTVLFGGFTGQNTTCCYSDETWLWDGTKWNRISKNPPPARALTAMWYDPNLKKDVIYGGVGQVTSNDRVTRYSDMWTFDGNGWSQLNPNGGTPGPRYGAQVVVDPHSNHLLLFGGLFDTITPAVPPATTPTEVQSYVNDMWEWDGSVWTQLHPPQVPSPRENGRMAFDPTRNEIVLFGGYAGAFFSETWIWDGTTWSIKIFDPLGGRRRVAGH